MVDQSFKILGKFMFEIYWEWPGFQQPGSRLPNKGPSSIQPANNYQGINKALNSKDQDSSWGMFACFSGKKKMERKDLVLPKTKVYFFDEK